MTSYIPKDFHRLVGANVSPMLAAAILNLAPRGSIERKLRGAPEREREQVAEELRDLELAAAFHRAQHRTANRLGADLSAPKPPEGETPRLAPVGAPAPSGESLEPWVSVAEAAQLLGTTDRTVRNYIAAGKLEARKKDRKSYLVARQSMEALLLVRPTA